MTDIISPLPFDMSNGTTADASQVMADLNQIRGDINSKIQVGGPGILLPPYSGAAVFNSLSLIIPATSPPFAYVLSFDTAYVDTASIFSVSTPTRLTVPTGASLIRLSYHVQLESESPSSMSGFTYIKTNGSVTAGITVPFPPIPNASTPQSATDYTSFPFSANPGDYFEVGAFFHTLGSVRDISPQWATFEMQILG